MQSTKEKNEFEKCPFCGNRDISLDEDNDGLWFCYYCGEKWEE